ncbi:hypothetical protein ACFTZK_07970 [Streptomyces decoyicus]|uniref:hypothetical protein n=1 Tax=Streptomyces decoyicus TaxID=249567 RepID=UPI003635B5CF
MPSGAGIRDGGSVWRYEEPFGHAADLVHDVFGFLVAQPKRGVRGHENRIDLERREVSVEFGDLPGVGHADNGDALVCWGTARMTMTGDRFGVVPDGRRAELPVFIQCAFKDGLIAGERFFFDLSALCAQSGVSTDAVRRTVFGDAADPEALPLGHRRPGFLATRHPHPPPSTSRVEPITGEET